MATQVALAFALALAGVNLSSAFVVPIAAPRQSAPPQSMARTPRQQGVSHTSLRSLRVAETAEDVMPDSQTLSEVSSISSRETGSRVQAIAVSACRGSRVLVAVN